MGSPYSPLLLSLPLPLIAQQPPPVPAAQPQVLTVLLLPQLLPQLGLWHACALLAALRPLRVLGWLPLLQGCVDTPKSVGQPVSVKNAVLLCTMYR